MVELSAGVVLTSVADGLRLTITPGEWSGNGRGDEENVDSVRVVMVGLGCGGGEESKRRRTGRGRTVGSQAFRIPNLPIEPSKRLIH